MEKFNFDWKDVLTLTIIICLFIGFSYLIQNNLDFFIKHLENNFIGMFFFVIIAILEVVFAPISIIPLIALASNIWGPLITIVLTTIGWTTGSVIAFLIAKNFGVSAVKRFVSINNIHYIEERIPQKHLFFGVIFLRLMIPIDLINYAIGLFTRMSWISFTFASMIAIIPLSFIFTYLGRLPLQLQLILLVMGIISLSVVYFLSELIRNKEK